MSSWGAFLGLAFQLALVLLLTQRFGIEVDRGLVKLTPLVFGGFLIHAILPLRLRLPFFLALSIAGFFVVFETHLAAALLAIGLGLIAVCHFPVPWFLRIVLLVGAGATLTAMCAGWIDAEWGRRIMPILGSIFMFRLVLYVYDLRTEKQRASPWETLSYFFLLPNAIFPLFPIIDFKTFRRTYYNRAANEIYAKGVSWMLRGILHLLLYRLIYQNYTPPAASVHDLGTLALYMVSGYALYLRVSGLFHLIVGMLCLFGFNLPETHHHYFLATGFNDLWRRINIYWKDFMMKIVYYPIFVRLRRRDATLAMVVATLVVFIVSWWLHSYQWFWIRGTFPLTIVDAIFWGIFAVAVLANSLLQSRRASARSLKGRAITPRAALARSLKVVSMFSVMCMLWTFWTGGTLEAWNRLLAAVAHVPTLQYVWMATNLLILVGLGVAYQLLVQRRWEQWQQRQSFARRSWASTVLMLGLLLLGTPELSGLHDNRLVVSVRAERLNEQDQALLLRGYYEEVLESERMLGGLWQAQANKPTRGFLLRQSGTMRYLEDEIHERELLPQIDTIFRDAAFRTNDWGLRDQGYSLAKPPRTCRIAVMGASVEMGSGVRNEEVFEALTETLLNEANTGISYDCYEVLNFAVNGLTNLAQVHLIDSRVLAFDPDIVLFFSHDADRRLVMKHIERIIARGTAIPDDLRTLLLGHPSPETIAEGSPESRLTVWRYQKSLLRWIYTNVVTSCRRAQVEPVCVYLPFPLGVVEPESARGPRMLEVAAECGFETIALQGDVLRPEGDTTSLVLNTWDEHPNPEGHRRIAKELFRQLIEHEHALGLGLTYNVDEAP